MIKKIPLPLIGDKTTLYRSNSGYKVVLAALTREEEEEIDRFHDVYGFYRYSKDGIVIAERDNIISYGEFNPDDKEDIEFIRSKNYIKRDGDVIIPSNYDYETNEVIIDTKKTKIMMNTITDNPVDWFLYNHGLINKPKHIIIYKVKL